ncbi:MAG: aldehyde dehydrogenase family protein, partial [Methylococcaceae bacterium]|nr:aldehyde dehydrogenase family protein [Methylococcaceae bacterium]
MIYANPNTEGAVVSFKERYENYIDGQWVAPVKGEYFTNHSPVTNDVICDIPRSSAEDIELALDAAHAAKAEWGKSSVTTRANILLKV